MVYSFHVIKGKEASFENSWSKLTEMIYTHANSNGSRLHKSKGNEYIAYASWPDKKTWKEGFSKLPKESEIISENETESAEIEEPVQNNDLENLSPEEQFQLALDEMMKKKYENSKISLEKFIEKFPDNQLSGSAHFWLGRIYQFEKNFRKAAIVFGEGVQKFPKSIKAAEMYYELSKSLKEMNKLSEACKTLEILSENYKESKFASDPEKINKSLECKNEN